MQNNHVTLIGEVVSNGVERVRTRNGGMRMHFTLKTTEVWYAKDPAARREHVEYHRVVMFDNGTGHSWGVSPNLIKRGKRLLVSGRIHYRLITDDAGMPLHVETDIQADGVEGLVSADAA